MKNIQIEKLGLEDRMRLFIPTMQKTGEIRLHCIYVAAVCVKANREVDYFILESQFHNMEPSYIRQAQNIVEKLKERYEGEDPIEWFRLSLQRMDYSDYMDSLKIKGLLKI